MTALQCGGDLRTKRWKPSKGLFPIGSLEDGIVFSIPESKILHIRLFRFIACCVHVCKIVSWHLEKPYLNVP